MNILQYLCTRFAKTGTVCFTNYTWVAKKADTDTDMNLIADIGNNSAKFFLFQDDRLVLHTRRNGSSYDVIKEWSEGYEIEKAIVSSVIDLSDEQKRTFEILNCPIVWFNSSVATPLGIDYNTPHTLGSDRLAAAVGAWNEKPGCNLLVIDAGSAITTDFVDRTGIYRGGNIAPGIRMRLRALHEYTGRLPLVEKEGEVLFLGKETETAIRSGVIRGICYEIEGYISEISQRFGEVYVFLTGGDEISLKNSIKSRIFADKFLVAKGLNRILNDYDKL